MTTAYVVTLQAPGEPLRSLTVEAHDRRHAITSALELAGSDATVIRCNRQPMFQ